MEKSDLIKLIEIPSNWLKKKITKQTILPYDVLRHVQPAQSGSSVITNVEFLGNWGSAAITHHQSSFKTCLNLWILNWSSLADQIFPFSLTDMICSWWELHLVMMKFVVRTGCLGVLWTQPGVTGKIGKCKYKNIPLGFGICQRLQSHQYI